MKKARGDCRKAVKDAKHSKPASTNTWAAVERSLSVVGGLLDFDIGSMTSCANLILSLFKAVFVASQKHKCIVDLCKSYSPITTSSVSK